MSRVRKPKNKYFNANIYDSSITGPSKMVRIHHDGEDYHKATTLSGWLFVKYNMSYKSYRNKSILRRNELKREFLMDTDWSFARYCRKFGETEESVSNESDIIKQAWLEEYKMWLEGKLDQYQLDCRTKAEIDNDSALQTLADCGVPFSPDGTPLGIRGID